MTDASSTTEWRVYERTGRLESRPWTPDFDMTMVSVSQADRAAGHPKLGGMIAKRNGITDDMWYIAPDFFAENYRPPPADAERQKLMQYAVAAGDAIVAAEGGSAPAADGGKVAHDMPDPDEAMLASPAFNAVWDAIKTWDVNVPGYYSGYMSATGSHVMLILNSLSRIAPEPGEYRIPFALMDSIYETLKFYANECSYQGERTGGVLQGCPRGPDPSPSQLAVHADWMLKKIDKDILGRQPETKQDVIFHGPIYLGTGIPVFFVRLRAGDEHR